MARYALLALIALALADVAEAQLTEFEGRVVSGAVFSRVYEDARAAIAAADTSGAWPSAAALPYGSRLTFEPMPGGAWAVGFDAVPFESDALRFGPTSGVLRVAADSDDVCRTVYEGSVSTGSLDWEHRSGLDLFGASSSVRSCRLEAAGAG